MRYRRCGSSGVLLPVISLGLWHNFGGDADYQASRKMLHHAFDRGITHFDLANNYGRPYGSAEETFGRVMRDSFRPYRHELFISTKAGHDMWPGPYGEWGSRKYLMNSLEQSLQRMDLEYVDIFYSHRYDPDTPLEETLQALVDIVRQGKALYAGISKYPPEAAKFAYGYMRDRDVPCLLYQGKYNMFYREPETEGIFQQARESGVGYIAFSPLAQGLLTDRYMDGKVPGNSRMAEEVFLRREHLTDDIMDRIRKLNAIAQRRAQSLAEMALAWVLKDEQVTSVIVGVSSLEQLEMNIRAVEGTAFTDDELEEIENVIG